MVIEKVRRNQDHLRHHRDGQVHLGTGQACEVQQVSDDTWNDVSSNDETAENAENITKNAADAQPETETQSIHLQWRGQLNRMQGTISYTGSSPSRTFVSELPSALN